MRTAMKGLSPQRKKAILTELHEMHRELHSPFLARVLLDGRPQFHEEVHEMLRMLEGEVTLQPVRLTKSQMEFIERVSQKLRERE